MIEIDCEVLRKKILDVLPEDNDGQAKEKCGFPQTREYAKICDTLIVLFSPDCDVLDDAKKGQLIDSLFEESARDAFKSDVFFSANKELQKQWEKINRKGKSCTGSSPREAVFYFILEKITEAQRRGYDCFGGVRFMLHISFDRLFERLCHSCKSYLETQKFTSHSKFANAFLSRSGARYSGEKGERRIRRAQSCLTKIEELPVNEKVKYQLLLILSHALSQRESVFWFQYLYNPYCRREIPESYEPSVYENVDYEATHLINSYYIGASGQRIFFCDKLKEVLQGEVEKYRVEKRSQVLLRLLESESLLDSNAHEQLEIFSGELSEPSADELRLVTG